MQERRERGADIAWEALLIPALAALAAVLGAARRDPCVARSALGQPHAGEHQDLLAPLAVQAAQLRNHWLDLYPRGAPSECIARRGNTTAEHVNEEAIVHVRHYRADRDALS